MLARLGASAGAEGNLWQYFVALSLLLNENPYSLSAEIGAAPPRELEELAQSDFAALRELFLADPAEFGDERLRLFTRFSGGRRIAGGDFFPVLDREAEAAILKLLPVLEKSADARAFGEAITGFYRTYGVGALGLNRAFYLEERGEDFALLPHQNPEDIAFDSLVGYESQKRRLSHNTDCFLRGLPANNVLLFGDAGTGKSSSIKALMHHYYKKGLRVVELYKHQFRLLPRLMERLMPRNYRFILYLDDLSFEDGEQEYKHLKALLEGGLAKRPDNVLIYATSNRRHLIRESFRDKEEADGELHRRDTVQEKLSLAARFGITIYYGSPDKGEFNKIVSELARRHHIRMEEAELLDAANRWELAHGGLSGRSARQFITYLQGR